MWHIVMSTFQVRGITGKSASECASVTASGNKFKLIKITQSYLWSGCSQYPEFGFRF